METKQVVYLSIVFSAFFLSMVFPFRALIGAPLSLVVLAYVSPKLSRKATVEMFAVLMLMNFALDLPDWLAWFTVGKDERMSIPKAARGLIPATAKVRLTIETI